MAHLINLKTFTDTRGSLTVIERVIPFEIKRIFYVNDPGHFAYNGYDFGNATHAVVCLKGSCRISSHTADEEQHFVLETADKCLLLAPGDQHSVREFTDESILMVMASEPFEAVDSMRVDAYRYEVA